MIKDPTSVARVLAVWQDRDNRPPEPALGPQAASRSAGADRLTSVAEVVDALGDVAQHVAQFRRAG